MKNPKFQDPNVREMEIKIRQERRIKAHKDMYAYLSSHKVTNQVLKRRKYQKIPKKLL